MFFTGKFFTVMIRISAATATAVATALTTKAVVETVGKGLKTLGENMSKSTGKAIEKVGKEVQGKAA